MAKKSEDLLGLLGKYRTSIRRNVPKVNIKMKFKRTSNLRIDKLREHKAHTSL